MSHRKKLKSLNAPIFSQSFKNLRWNTHHAILNVKSDKFLQKRRKKIKTGKFLKKLRVFEKSGEFLKKNENGERNASLRTLGNKKGRRRVASARKSQAA
jgi:hypothetical protein